MPDYFIHESSYVDDGAVIGKGTKIWHFSHVMAGAVIGERCNLGQNVVVMPGTRIGNNVKIQNNVSIYEGVTLEDDVFCGPSCVFTNVMNPRSHVSRKHEYRPTLVRRGTTVGANATIVCGTTLGEYSFIGAGAVVTSDVAPFAIMVGVPARRVGWMCQCGVRLQVRDGKAVCGTCRVGYREAGGGLTMIDPPPGRG
jgi:UDP-2-acetamido-3-amino-2,3-dideoxy-glucuronate N-acetyltransferase